MNYPEKDEWEVYKAYREQWTHEDNLIDHRVSWLILSQTILFASFGLFLQASIDAQGRLRILVKLLLLLTPIFGILISTLFRSGIVAAFSAMEKVRENYDSSGLSDKMPLFPSEDHLYKGGLPAKRIVIVFIAMWVIVLLGYLYVLYVINRPVF